jgi:hypothetical protein
MRVSVLEPAPNQALEPTPYNLRFASASGRGSPPAFGVLSRKWNVSLGETPHTGGVSGKDTLR